MGMKLSLRKRNPRPKEVILNIRIGIDLDKPSILTRLFAFYNLSFVNTEEESHEIRIFRSCSGSGFHLELRGVAPNLNLRRACRDDPKRLIISERRYGIARFDVLFQEKRSDFQRNKSWRKRERINFSQYIPLPFTLVKRLFFINRRKGQLVKPKERKLKRNPKWKGRW